MNGAFFSSSHAKFSTNSVNHRGWAWMSLCLALAAHVFDEAMTDFLSVYNPTVLAIRQKFQFFPMPVFTFEVWLTGLIAAIIILLLLAPFAFRQRGWIRLLSYPFAILMLLNGLRRGFTQPLCCWPVRSICCGLFVEVEPFAPRQFWLLRRLVWFGSKH